MAHPSKQSGCLCVLCHHLCLAFPVIVTEKTNILLRYLHQQWDKKVQEVGFGCWDRGGD